jgi:plastocyanin
LSFILSAISVAVAGWGGTGEEPAAPAESPAPAAGGTPAPAQPAAAVAPVASADITGKVVYEGTPPERAVLETQGDPKCFAMHKDAPLLSDREVVSADGGVQWAFVYVKNAPAGDYPVPGDEVVLDQVGCRYTPHVLGVRVGQTLALHNSDALLHNVRAIARENKPINYGQPAGSAPRKKVFDKAEMEIRIKCDVHPWMTAFTFAMDHPFFAVTDENGAFTIPNLPAGDYTLVCWHESYGEQEMIVSVKGGAPTDVSFTVKPKE